MRKQDRSREAAFVIPIFGLFLLLPPILSIFDSDTTVMGIPLLHVYVFGVWLGLVIAGAWLARRMREHEADRNPADGAGDPPRLADADDSRRRRQ